MGELQASAARQRVQAGIRPGTGLCGTWRAEARPPAQQRAADGRGQPLLLWWSALYPAASARPRSSRQWCRSGWPVGRPSAARGPLARLL